MPRTLSEIATEIKADWKKPYYGAVPYIDALATMQSIGDDYGADPGAEIVLYFLSNANTWRGETAKRVKAELKAIHKSAKGY